MLWTRRRSGPSPGVAAVAVGAALGTVAAVYLGVRQLRARRARRQETTSEFEHLEEATVEALRSDEVAGERPIDVAAIGDGIIELTGSVRDLAEAHHVVEVAQRVDGVHTVVNRLTLGELEHHLAETRGRFMAGDPRLHEVQHYGTRAGMGRRPQSRDTEPARSDDSVSMIDRELEPDAPGVVGDQIGNTGAVPDYDEAEGRPGGDWRSEH